MSTELVVRDLLHLPAGDMTPLQRSLFDFLFTLGNMSTRRAYGRVLASYLAFLRSKGCEPHTLEELDHKHAQLFRTELATRNAPSTVYDKMMMLSAWYRFEVDRGGLKSNPIAFLRLKGGHEPIRPTPALSSEEVIRVRAYLTGICQRTIGTRQHLRARRYHCLFNLLLATGARIASLCELKLGQLVHTSEGTELCLKVKGGDQGRIILHPKAALILNTFIQEWVDLGSPEGVIFHSRHAALTPRAVNYFFKSLAKELKISVNFHPHVMRATMSTLLHDQNVSMLDIKHLGLWRDHRMPEKYVRIRNRRLHAASLKMPL